MKSNKVLIPSIISIIFLLVALFPIGEYGYYILLRLIVCATASYSAYQAYLNHKEIWTWVMAMIAILFNPVMPIHLSKEIWMPIDLITSIIFILNIFFIKRQIYPNEGV